jgi:formylglycine-generating enzyme required for sulfatase activity
VAGLGLDPSFKADLSCVSDWGAEDMIGNLFEWTSEWYASVGDASPAYDYKKSWPSSYGQDDVDNISSSAFSDDKVAPNIPAAALRGGRWGDGQGAGIFALDLDLAPSQESTVAGFRCVIPR